jgi:two-component system, response regulator
MVMAEIDAKPDLLFIAAESEWATVCRAALQTCSFASRLTWVSTPVEGRDFLFCEGKHKGRNIADRPRAVFLELKPPIEEKIEFIHAVKSNERLKRVPIVVLAASIDENMLVECYKNSGNSFVNMPNIVEQSVELIKQIGRYWLSVNRSPS